MCEMPRAKPPASATPTRGRSERCVGADPVVVADAARPEHDGIRTDDVAVAQVDRFADDGGGMDAVAQAVLTPVRRPPRDPRAKSTAMPVFDRCLLVL